MSVPLAILLGLAAEPSGGVEDAVGDVDHFLASVRWNGGLTMGPQEGL